MHNTTPTVAQIRNILSSSPGSKSKLARMLKTQPAQISHWLAGNFTSARFYRAACTLARRIAKKQNPGGTSV